MTASSSFIAIAGNPNSGKTTAFNKYTGARQHVGNYPGITVEKKGGIAHIDGENIYLVDLPGTYSLTAYSKEEVVARNVLVDEKPGCVLNVLNAGVLERNLYLTVQLMEMGIPIVLALNMMDEAKSQGMHIDLKKLEELTGIKAISTVAKTGEGLKEALKAAVVVAKESEGKEWKPLHISYGADIDAGIAEMLPLIDAAQTPFTGKCPSRWLALKVMENDSEVMAKLQKTAPQLVAELSPIVEKVVERLQKTGKAYPESLIAEYRYGYIASLLRQGVVTNVASLQDRVALSDKIDSILTHKFVGPIIMIGLFYFMYLVTFELGAYPQEWVENGFGALKDFADANMADSLLKSLVVSGIIEGVGGVFSFVPLIIIMFLFIAFLDDLGYMARIAYMWDRIFRFFGLHGASVMPFIISGGISGGCAVPGIMATRTLRSPKERLATILTAPFMACGAKLPVFLLFIGIFFPENQAGVMLLLSLAGWVAALLVARLLRSTLVKGEATPFVMELPPYRMPTLTGMLLHTWERTWMYVKKAGTIILAIAIIIWAGMTFPSLPEEKSAPFEQERSVFENQLEALPYGKLQKEIAELDAKKAEKGLSPADIEGIEKEKSDLQNAFDELPYAKLKSTAGELEEELSDVEEELAALVEKYTAAVELLRDDEAALEEKESARAALAGFKQDLGKTELGKKVLELTSLQMAMEELPEHELLAGIEEVDNRESVAALRYSVAGRIGTALEPVSNPAGFDWRTNIALVGGVAAKEVIVSTLGTAYSLGTDVDADGDATLKERIKDDPNWTKANAVALMLFTLLYSPCFVAVVMIKHETASWKWAIFSVIFNLVFAYAVAVLANQAISAML